MIDFAVRAIGIFYAFGGLLVLRALRMSRLLDMMHAALTGKSLSLQKVRAGLLAAGGVLTAVSGLALLALNSWASVLLLLNCGMQLLWLGFSARYFPAEDEEDRQGRLRTIRATIALLCVTILIVWLERQGMLVWRAGEVTDAIIAVVAVALSAWQALSIARFRMGGAQPDDPPAEEFLRPGRVHIEPRQYKWVLWDADTGDNLSPHRMELSEALVEQIVAFDEAVSAAFDAEAPGGSKIADKVTREAFERDAMALSESFAILLGADHVSWRLPEDNEEWECPTIS